MIKVNLQCTALSVFGIILLTNNAFGQYDEGFAPGARAAGMGYAAVAIHDPWSMQINTAGIASEKKYSAGFAFNNRYTTAGFNTLAVYGIIPVKQGVAGFQISRFGDPIYNQHNLSFGYAHKIKFVSLGLQTSYHQIAIEGLGAKGNILINFGGIAELTEELSFGATIFNITQAKLAEYRNERIPTIMKAGISYHPGDKIMVNGEVEKDIDYRATLKGGIEYRLLEQFVLRTGASLYPFQNHFGASFHAKKLRFDYALSTHSQLGISNHISLVYWISDHDKK